MRMGGVRKREKGGFWGLHNPCVDQRIDARAQRAVSEGRLRDKERFLQSGTFRGSMAVTWMMGLALMCEKGRTTRSEQFKCGEKV